MGTDLKKLRAIHRVLRSARYGETVRRLRGNMSQRAFAELIRCDHSYISRIERGLKPLTLKMAERIITALDK